MIPCEASSVERRSGLDPRAGRHRRQGATVSSTMSHHHDILSLRPGPHIPALGPHVSAIEGGDPDAVLACVAAALDSGEPDLIDDAYIMLRRAIRSLLHLPDPTV